jgi:hypothetical protein
LDVEQAHHERDRNTRLGGANFRGEKGQGRSRGEGRAKALTAKRRSEIAKKAAQALWKKRRGEKPDGNADRSSRVIGTVQLPFVVLQRHNFLRFAASY